MTSQSAFALAMAQFDKLSQEVEELEQREPYLVGLARRLSAHNFAIAITFMWQNRAKLYALFVEAGWPKGFYYCSTYQGCLIAHKGLQCKKCVAHDRRYLHKHGILPLDIAVARLHALQIECELERMMRGEHGKEASAR